MLAISSGLPRRPIGTRSSSAWMTFSGTVLMIGVFLGSIGFPVIYTLARHRWHVRHWSLHTKLTLVTTVLLFVVGALAFLSLEAGNPATIGRKDAFDAVFQSFWAGARSDSFSAPERVLAMRASKWRASAGISPVRSRSGGIVTWTTLSR